MLRSLALLAVLAVSVTALAQEPAKTAAAPDPGFNLPVDELILDNGMKVLTVERPTSAREFCILYWKVGSVNERPGITGLSHFFEHMMFKGTDIIGTKDPKADRELNAKIEGVMGEIRKLKLRGLEALRLGLPLSELAGMSVQTIRADDESAWKKLNADYEALIKQQKTISVGEHLSKLFQENGGTGLNAQTSHDWTRYFVDLPTNKVELFFWLESDRFLAPVFREFYPERENVKEERRLRVDATPTGPLMEAFDAQFWQSHPYKWPVIGWMSDIDQYTYADAQRYYETHYVPENCTAIFVGGCKKEDIRALAKKYFARLPKAKAAPDAIVTLEAAQIAEKRMAAEADTQPLVHVRWHGPSQAHADAAALDVLSTVLSGRSGRLYKPLVVDKKLALGASASYDGRKYGGILSVSATPRGDADPLALEKELIAVVEKLKTDKVSDAELQRAQNQMCAQLIRDLDTNMSIASHLGSAEILNSWKDLFTAIPDIRKVTADDLLRVTKQYYPAQGRTVLHLKRKAD